MNTGKTQTKAIVNVSTNKGNYYKSQERLRQSLIGRTDADVYMFKSEIEVLAPLHRDNNYAFKVYAIDKMFQKGYTQVLWLDSSVYAINDLKPIWDIIDKKGYFIQYSGWKAEEWTNDRTLKAFGLKREDMKIPMFSSGVTGINLNHPIGKKFFELWTKSMIDGYFIGDWSNHRHDQSLGSIIAYQLGMEQEEGDVYYQYKYPEKPIKETTIFLLEGL